MDGGGGRGGECVMPKNGGGGEGGGAWASVTLGGKEIM